MPYQCESYGRGFGHVSGGRVRNTWVTNLDLGDTHPKGWLIPHTFSPHEGRGKLFRKEWRIQTGPRPISLSVG